MPGRPGSGRSIDFTVSVVTHCSDSAIASHAGNSMHPVGYGVAGRADRQADRRERSSPIERLGCWDDTAHEGILEEPLSIPARPADERDLENSARYLAAEEAVVEVHSPRTFKWDDIPTKIEDSRSDDEDQPATCRARNDEDRPVRLIDEPRITPRRSEQRRKVKRMW
jgi:hypothetical protein